MTLMKRTEHEGIICRFVKTKKRRQKNEEKKQKNNGERKEREKKLYA